MVRRYRRYTLMMNEEILNFEDEILLRGIDCNVATMIDNNSVNYKIPSEGKIGLYWTIRD
jgi:hypothetical protein